MEEKWYLITAVVDSSLPEASAFFHMFVTIIAWPTVIYYLYALPILY